MMNGLGVGFYPYWKPKPPFREVYNSLDDRNYSSNNTGTSGNSNNGRRKWVYVIILALQLLLLAILVIALMSPELAREDPILDFQVNSLEVSSMKVYNISNDYYSIVGGQKHITADFYFNLSLRSKDKVLMYFNPMQASLEYDNDHEFLSSTMLEPFLLLENQHQLQFRMQVKDDDARLKSETVDSISRDLWGENVVQFALKAQGNCVRWHRGGFQNCGVDLLCDDIEVGFPPENNLTTGSMTVSPLLCKCKFDCDYVIR